MREIVNVQVGQCGNQIGSEVSVQTTIYIYKLLLLLFDWKFQNENFKMRKCINFNIYFQFHSLLYTIGIYRRLP